MLQETLIYLFMIYDCILEYMEITLGIIIGITIAILISRRKNKHTVSHDTNINKTVSNDSTSIHDKKRQIDKEIITVILPTINNK